MGSQSVATLETTGILGVAATGRGAGVDRADFEGSARRADCAGVPSTGPEAPARRGGAPSGPTQLQVKRAADLVAESRKRRLSGPELLELAECIAERRLGMFVSPSPVEAAAGILKMKRGDARAALDFAAESVPVHGDAEPVGYWFDVCCVLAAAMPAPGVRPEWWVSDHVNGAASVHTDSDSEELGGTFAKGRPEAEAYLRKHGCVRGRIVGGRIYWSRPAGVR
jgi:hypothetical protein